MRLSALIEKLTNIQSRYGDIAVTGGAMVDDQPLSNVSVTDTDGVQIWPTSNRQDGLSMASQGVQVDGVFFQ
jgi:hypothetical protein